MRNLTRKLLLHARSSERGQAGLEWTAVLGVVGSVLVAGAAGAVPGAGAVGDAVRGGFVRAFCLVSGGDCLSEAGPRPCVVSSVERARERRASALLVRLSDGRSVLRERRSDGSVVVTVEDGVRGAAGPSYETGFDLAGRGVKASVGARLGLRGGVGRRFVVADDAAADALIAQLDAERGGVRAVAGRMLGEDADGPVPDEQWWVLGHDGELDAVLKAGRLGATAKALQAVVLGVRVRPRTGERTLVLRNDGEYASAFSAPLAKLGLGAPNGVMIELALDARDRPLSLTVRGFRGLHGDLAIGSFRPSGGNLVEIEARLELTDPELLALVRELVEAARSASPGRALAAARAIGERLVDRARIDVRVYLTERSARSRGGTLPIGGYTVEELTRTARLLEAVGREPGMGWARRLDCLGVA